MASDHAAASPAPRFTGTLTVLSLLAFAGNSLLTRLALQRTMIDPASFTTLRLASGALALLLIVLLRGGARRVGGTWSSAAALFVYAAAFSYAYVGLTAGTGALLLFGAVQATMITVGLLQGERLSRLQSAGLVCAYGGLLVLVLPGLSSPPLLSAFLMCLAGGAWGMYSLRARRGGEPVAATTGNFVRALPLAIVLSLLFSGSRTIDARGVLYAVASGALTSGLGYAIWYTALRGLRATSAATVQLSVPVIAALGGVVLLGEPVTFRLVGSAVTILGGVALVVFAPKPRQVLE